MEKEYLQPAAEVLARYGSSTHGLSPEKAKSLLSEYGHNILEEGKKKGLIQKIWEQIKDPMILVLIAAAVLSGVFGEIVDMIVILVVVVLNSILGIVQEGKAEEAIAALKKSSTPHSRVRREGMVCIVPSSTLVPGDVILLEAGDTVPADTRLFTTISLKIEEAVLTGESMPVEKNSETLISASTDIVLGDRTNMAYSGTNVSYGKAEGVVVATGMNTEMGKIAGLLATTNDESTPLQKKLASLSKVLSIGVLAICFFIFVFMVLREGGFAGSHVFEALIIAISLAVAAIPEGLVVVVTVLLSVGVTSLSKRNAIIRRLTAVETLGCTQVICSDKTGTLTQNKMTVVEHYGNELLIAKAMGLCNDATTDSSGCFIGDPTEIALLDYAQEMLPQEIREGQQRVAEAPFDSERKMMSAIHEGGKQGGYIQYTKGAPDEILRCCTHIIREGSVEELNEACYREVLQENKLMADKALRVLAAAYREYDEVPASTKPDTLERNLTFIGLAGMIDPIRPEVKAAVKTCAEACIDVVMITGDHKDTAVAIGRDLGLLDEGSRAITGAELSEMSNSELSDEIASISVYARVQPEHKVRIVDMWQEKGKITAMTGDGVNDAPALKSADIGIGMGITGTEVTKGVADMVLADDNFATIVTAVEEGRRIYENIRKAIQFLLASNLSEVLSIFIATILGWKLFAPIHILWINLITDTFPALGLGMEKEKGLMQRPPRDPKEGIFAGGLGIDIIWQGIVIGLLTLFSFSIGAHHDQATGMSMAFLTLSLCEIFHSLNMRSRNVSLFKLKSQNKYLWSAILLSFVLTLGVMYIPGLNTAFQLTALPVLYFVYALGLAILIIPIVEIYKFFKAKLSS